MPNSSSYKIYIKIWMIGSKGSWRSSSSSSTRKTWFGKLWMTTQKVKRLDLRSSTWWTDCEVDCRLGKFREPKCKTNTSWTHFQRSKQSRGSSPFEKLYIAIKIGSKYKKTCKKSSKRMRRSWKIYAPRMKESKGEFKLWNFYTRSLKLISLKLKTLKKSTNRASRNTWL